MFSKNQKIKISQAVEELLLSFNHPEMPVKKPEFRLHVKGKESWSWADIEPNWKYETEEPGINPFNEMQAELMKKQKTTNNP